MSINWPWLQIAAARFLPVVFLPLSAADAVASVARGWLGTDAHLYYAASAAWLDGRSPWDVFVINQDSVYHYYALPTATVLLAPLTALPENVFVAGWIVAQCLSALWVVRRLELPWWWVAFPPMVNGILAGNPSPMLVALLVASHPILKAIAPLLKVYAGLPLLGERRWRAIALAAILGVFTIVIAPGLWADFIAGSGGRTGQQLAESRGGYNGFGNLPLMGGAAVAVLVIARRDLRAAGWLAPIALWPGSQFHWSTLAMPVMTLPMAYLLALPGLGLPPIAIMVYAIVSEFRYRLNRRCGA